MNWVDIAILVVILLSALVGLARGLVREVLSLGVWLVALAVGYFYYKGVAEWLTAYIDQPNVRLALAFVGIVLVVLVLGSILSALLSALIHRTGLTGVDRVLGLVFGTGRGIVLVAMAVFLGALTPMVDEPWWRESKTIVQFQHAANWLLSLVPPGLQEQLKRV